MKKETVIGLLVLSFLLVTLYEVTTGKKIINDLMGIAIFYSIVTFFFCQTIWGNLAEEFWKNQMPWYKKHVMKGQEATPSQIQQVKLFMIFFFVLSTIVVVLGLLQRFTNVL